MSDIIPKTFDVIYSGGTVVNQDGTGITDVGIRGRAHRCYW